MPESPQQPDDLLDPVVPEPDSAADLPETLPGSPVANVHDPNFSMVRDSVQTFLAHLASIIVSVVSSVILGRTLLPTGKGLFAILILIPRSAWTFGTLGLDQVNTVYAGREPERRHELATTSLFLGMILSLVVVVVVAIFLYWPGHGAARIDIHPGDFLIEIEGQPVDEAGLLRLQTAPGDSTLPVTIWRQGARLERQLPIETKQVTTPLIQEFRLSALNSWRYGLSANPRFSMQVWYPALDAGLVALDAPAWDELERRRTTGLLPTRIPLSDRQPAFLVGDVGGGHKQLVLPADLERLLMPGDVLLAIDGQPFASDAALTQVEWPTDREQVQLTVFRRGALRDIEQPLQAPGPPESRVLNLAQAGLREYALLKNLEWQEQTYLPTAGMALTPITDVRLADLQSRFAIPKAVSPGTKLPSMPAMLVTQVDYPWLRRWSQDLPRNLFMLTMLFFPLTASAYLMDSIIYGLNLMKLRNQKSVITNAAMSLLYFLGLYLYGFQYRGYTPHSVEGLIALLEIAVWLTLLHGVFIALYSYYLIAPRAEFARKHINLAYVGKCFRTIGWQSYIANSASYLFYDVDIFIITSLIAQGATTITLDNLGNYTQATNIVERVWIIPGAIATALLPKITTYGLERAGELTPKSVRHTLVLTIAILVPLCLLLPWLLPVLWGPAFLPTLGPFYLLAPGILLFSLSKVYSAHLLGIGKPIYAMWYSVLGVTVNVLMNYVLIPQEAIIFGIPIGGINGAAIASTVAYSLHSMLMMSAYCKESGNSPAMIFRFTKNDWLLYGRASMTGIQMIRRVLGMRTT